MQYSFNQNFLSKIGTVNGKSVITKGIFKDTLVFENEDGSHTFTRFGENGDSFQITTNRKNIDESVLVGLFIDHISKICAEFILTSVFTKNSMHKNGEQLSIKPEHLPFCLKCMSKLFYETVIFVNEQLYATTQSASQVVMGITPSAKVLPENKKPSYINMSVRELLIDSICNDVHATARDFIDKFHPQTKEKLDRFNKVLQDTYAETALLICENVFHDDGKSADSIRFNVSTWFNK